MPKPAAIIEKIARTTTTERVEQALRDAILTGRFATGDKLPPERELAIQLGVTRVTLRSALARLGASGLVSTVQGRWTSRSRRPRARWSRELARHGRGARG
jgi:DNA-binding FadR family transcriptional regulator